MYVLLLLHAIYVIASGESCTTPSGAPGRCVPIRSCPTIIWSLANVNFKTEDNLEKYICSNGELGLIVCCREENGHLVFENEDNINPVYDDIYELNELRNTEDCGISSNPISNGLINLQDYPWLVKVMIVINFGKEDRITKLTCTGVLINKLYILVSAQCHHFNMLKAGAYFAQIQSYVPRLEGCDTHSYAIQCSYHQNYEIQFRPHPFYDYLTKLNDIALLRLNRRVYDSEHIRPICLPVSRPTMKDGEMLLATGWNRTYIKSDITMKHSQTSVIISNIECQKMLRESGKNVSLTPFEMCTYTNESVINEDAIGLPLMSLHGNRWYIEGFESEAGNTKIYSRVESYLQWIQKAMGGERCRTPYNETGEGAFLSECPKLMDAFANPHPDDQQKLRKFAGLWSHETINDQDYVLKVCCGLTSNFITPPETVAKNLDFDVSDYRFCGLQHRDDYISSNHDISVDEYPWLAIVMRATLLKQRESVCGGSLITNRYVLTSAQCVGQFYVFDTIMVRLGDYHFRNKSDCVEIKELSLIECNDIQEYVVDKKIVHFFYNSATYVNDIALLRLSKPVMFSDYVRPICLPRSEDDLPTYGETLFSTGFGDININYAGMKIKKKIRTTLITNEDCKFKINIKSAVYPITPYQICTEDFKNSTDVICVGDEGGPVMSSKKSQWFIVGISSNYACRNNQPQTHLNVYKYLKWIKMHIQDN